MERIFLLRLWKSWCIELFVWFCSSLKDEKFNFDDQFPFQRSCDNEKKKIVKDIY